MADDMDIFDDILGESLETKEKDVVKFKPKIRPNTKPLKGSLGKQTVQQNDGADMHLNSELDFVISPCSTTGASSSSKGKLQPQRKSLRLNSAPNNIDEFEGLNQKNDTTFEPDIEVHTTFNEIDSLDDFSLEPPPPSVEKFQPKETNKKGKGKKVTLQLPDENRVLDSGPVTSDVIHLTENSENHENTQNDENIAESTETEPDLDSLFDFWDNSGPVPEININTEEAPGNDDCSIENEKRAKTQSEQVSRKRKKSSTDLESNVSEDNSEPKKNGKLSHRTRTKGKKRRQLDPALLEMADGEIDRRQISIKNLILLAESKEKKNKDANVKKKSSAQSSELKNKERDEFDFDFDGDQIEKNQEEEEDPDLLNEPPKKLNYHSYMNRSYNGRWSKSDTELFYTGIRQFGTDFEMIKHLFPNKTRRQIRDKFKNEDKKNPINICDAITSRLNDNSQYEKVLEILQIEPTKYTPDEGNNKQAGEGKKEEQQEDMEEENYENTPEEFNSSGKQEDLSNEVDLDALFDWD